VLPGASLSFIRTVPVAILLFGRLTAPMALQATIFLLLSFLFSTCRADYNVTVYPESSSDLFKYVGDWTSGASTETIGASMAFNFTGDALYLMMYRGPYCGLASVNLDGKDYSFDGFSQQTDDMVCGLCIDDLPLQEHFLNVTLTSHGRSTVENFTYLLVYDIIYTANGSDPNGFPTNSPYNSGSDSSTPSSSSSSSGVSIPLVVGATVGVIAIVASSAIAVYFYRRNRRIGSQSRAPIPAWQNSDYQPPPPRPPAGPSYNDAYDMQYRQNDRPDLSRLMIPGSTGAYKAYGQNQLGPTPSGSSVSPSEYDQPQIRPLLSEKQRLTMAADGHSSTYDASPTLSRGPSTYSHQPVSVDSHAPMPPTTNVEQLRAQVERLANMLEDREAPPPAYDGDAL